MDSEAKSHKDPGWPAFLYWARKYFELPSFEPLERTYKFQAVRGLKEARSQLFQDGDWFPHLKQGFTNKDNNLVSHWAFRPFLQWVEQEPSLSGEALSRLWTPESTSPEERLDGFSNLFPVEYLSGLGGRCNLGAYLLGAIHPKRWPNYRVTATNHAYTLTRYPSPSQDVTMGQLYRHALEFFDRIIAEGAASGLELRDRLDAQGVMWCVTHWANPREGPFPPDEWNELLEFRAIRPNASKPRGTSAKKRKISLPPNPVCDICGSDEEVSLIGRSGQRWLFVCEIGRTHDEPYEFTARS